MKRCPECMRNYSDETLNYCLDDGTPLVYGPAVEGENPTAILYSTEAPNPMDYTNVREAFPLSATHQTSAPPSASVAVLPFAHLSSEPDDEFFCDGLAEELLNALSHIENLKVAARTSSFAFKGKGAHISEIGRNLGVRTVLEGSVRKAGGSLRITVQLVNAADGYHVWSERYDREMRDIFQIQDEITLAVVDALKLNLIGDERSALLRKGTENAEALECYLRGRALWNRRTYAELKKGIGYFERAIELDPKYAEAYAGLADCYITLAYFEAYSPIEMKPKALSAVEKAIELGPSLSESHSSLAVYKIFFEFDMAAGEREHRKALSIKPNSSLTHYWLCSTLAAMGRHEESLAEGRMALKLDPLSAVASSTMARALCSAGKFEEAIEVAKRSFEVHPNFFLSHWVLGWAYEQLGQLDTAIDHFRIAVKDGGLRLSGYLGKALVRAGKTVEARGLLAELEEQAKHRFVSPVSSAVIVAELGDMPEALDLLEKAWKIRSFHFIWAQSDQLFDVFRSESRFNEICRQIIVT